MNEITKTVVIVVAACVVSLLAIFSRPSPPGVEPREEIGEKLFDNFDDPLAASSLAIVEFDEELGEIRKFTVQEDADGTWSIPSHQNYPADAKDQVRDAATSLIGLTISDVASEVPSDHGTFGVLEPDEEQIEAGDTGVGMMIFMKDKEGDDLARVIIGKKVKGGDELRFVRLPSQDRVYTVNVDPKALSTKFEDWIETDLLKISEWDIKQVIIKDYSVQTALGPDLRMHVTDYDQRLQMMLSLDNSKWSLDELLETRGDQTLMPTELLGGEELDSSRMDDMKRALADLEIVDVERKPEGLGKELRAEEDFLEDSDSLQSLVRKGFYPVKLSDSSDLELLSSDGEIIVHTEDGVEYLLRFGQVAGLEESDESGEAEGLNRYLFVTTRLWAEKFPPPVQEPAGPADDVPAPEPENGDEVESGDEAETGNEAESGDEAETGDEAEADADAENSDEQKEQDEQDSKRKEAEEKVQELNDRFSSWYYVIAEDVFKKIHLGRADVIKEAEGAQEEGFGVDSFRKLQEEGLEKQEEEPQE